MSDNNNSNNPDYIEYYMLHASKWSNDWITIGFCCMCGITFDPDTTGNVYKLKKEYFDLCFCEPCLLELKKRNVIKKWEKIEMYWSSLQIPELQ
jgi:hypothetical protein